MLISEKRPAVQPRGQMIMSGLGYGIAVGAITGVMIPTLFLLFFTASSMFGQMFNPAVLVYWLVACLAGLIIGSIVGLAAGAAGGLVFAVSARFLARHRWSARIAGALVGTAPLLYWSQAIWPDAGWGPRFVFAVIPHVLYGIVGASLAPKVLYGEHAKTCE